jgi:beta-fructofuranosidase
LTALRSSHRHFRGTVHPGDTNPLAGIQGQALEILVELNSSGAESVALDVAAAPDGSEVTTVRYSRVARRLSIDRSRSNVEPDAPHDLRSIPLVVGSQEVLRLHLFLDASTLEVYAHGQVLTSRIYPRAASTGVAFSVSGGSVGGTLDVWTLDSIW